ncbi:MAG TPA: hypothetical protein VLF60_03405 [Candidatus Saccharimonadales bacterium]|nr:hypothetical protein [Candidatus Saccharimonadales bacterium]
MNIISCGAQYRVIDLQNGRVQKNPLTRQESAEVVASWRGTAQAPVEGRVINYRRAAISSARSVQRLIEQYPEMASSFGNPIFEGTGVYTQDHVVTFGAALKKETAECKKAIESYVDLILLHWRYGVAELAFNSTLNNGLHADCQVMLLDFGEITTSKMRVMAQIKTQRWLRAWSYNGGDIPAALQEYYRDRLSARLTLEAFDALWKTALSSQVL